jgi:ribonuclease P/MRP protein subunit RPP40
LCWISSFLTGRTQSVVFSGAQSEPTEVISGVIQGSVLGPLLFNIFVADLPNNIKTQMVQYADDCTVYNEIRTQMDIDELQDDLHTTDLWCNNNGMELNSKKCKIMDITHAQLPLNNVVYKIGNSELAYVKVERLLGVNISDDLKWNHHTDIVRAKAAKVLSFAARNMQGCTPRVKRMAYQSLVKPIMFYATPAWTPALKVNTQKLVKVQKRALRFIYKNNAPPPRQQNIMPIEMQLRYNDLVFFKSCLSGATDFDPMGRIIEGRIMRGVEGEHRRLIPPRVRSEFGQSAYSFRIVSPWNNLPPALKDCPFSHFKTPCRQYLWQNFNP